LVYILVANKSYKYLSGRRSYIIYIGTTGKGAKRPASSAVSKASQVFYKLHGIKTIEVYLVTCPGRKAMRTWKHLESALIHAFVTLHYQLPRFNKQKPTFDSKKAKLFKLTALRGIIGQFEP
jgi:hypothetical protein